MTTRRKSGRWPNAALQIARSEPPCMTKKLYIETVGCQMNVLDSELVVASLRRAGLRADRTARATPT